MGQLTGGKGGGAGGAVDRNKAYCFGKDIFGKGLNFCLFRWTSNDQSAFSFRGLLPPDLRTRHGAPPTTDPFRSI